MRNLLMAYNAVFTYNLTDDGTLGKTTTVNMRKDSCEKLLSAIKINRIKNSNSKLARLGKGIGMGYVSPAPWPILMPCLKLLGPEVGNHAKAVSLTELDAKGYSIT
ncbi:hypothetical protein RUM43_006961 [Polyplax serrata]|uniref:Uncharacterized protein n=1 Tax=Polyplax serrata TaxID=468196 RepID=A0AAN8P180_POLSC